MSSHSADAHTRPLTGHGLGDVSPSGDWSSGMMVGPYRLRRMLGQGGMGQVWLAEQQEPLRRLVALKLQQQRWSGSVGEVLFHIERQALAQLLHPYVAQIYDAGQLPDGSLYFAMEYVDGLTLDRYVAENRLGIRATVELLIRVCQGVQHAHQRGLIHRDLKPGNVLVLDAGNQAIPKIIDFGVAIGVDPRTGAAADASSVGTPAYMAPEQLRPGNNGLDVRVDVYALGTVLVECLVLALELRLDLQDSDQLRSLLGDTVSQPGRNQASAVGKSLARRMPAELRAIARKATHPEREQRYASVAELAEDLQRWRESRPVQAMGLGRWYAVRCFAKRYRLLTSAAAVALLALFGGLTVAWYGLAQAQLARELAEARGDRAEQLIGYMLGDFSDKLRALGKLELLDGVGEQAMSYLAKEGKTSDAAATLGGQPVRGAFFRARAMRTLGEVRNARGDRAGATSIFAEAEAMLERADPESVPITERLLEQGSIAYWRGFMAFSERNFDQAEKHWMAYQGYAKQLVPLTEASGKGLSELAFTYTNLGSLAFERKQWETAEKYFLEAIEKSRTYLSQRPDDELTIALANRYSWLGRTFENQSDLRRAGELYQQQLGLLDESLRKKSDDSVLRYHLAMAHYWLASNSIDRGRIEPAVLHFERALTIWRELVALEPANVSWQSLRRASELELLWLNWLNGNADDDGSSLLAEIQESKHHDPRGSRFELRFQLRLAIHRANNDGQWQRLDALVKSFDGANSDHERRLLQTAQLEVARYHGVVNDMPMLDALTKLRVETLDFRDADIVARYALLRGDVPTYQRIRDRFHEIDYRHPDFERFVSMFFKDPKAK